MIWDISTGSSPFSVARSVPEILRSLSLLVTKCMNYEIFVEEGQISIAFAESIKMKVFSKGYNSKGGLDLQTHPSNFPYPSTGTPSAHASGLCFFKLAIQTVILR